MTTDTATVTPNIVTDASFAEDVLTSKVPVLVDFWAPRCSPCLAIAPVLNELAAEYAGRLTIAKLNADEHPVYATQLGIRGLPTVILFKDGREVERLVGTHSKRQYKEHIEGLLAGEE